jgi:UDP-N-acetylglucosamine acyltransferase
MSRIHPTAIVEDGARLGAGVAVGPYALIGREVTLGDGVAVDAHAIVRGRTTVGPGTAIGAHATIGGDPQDLSYRGEDTAVEIGPRCLLREYVTVHRGTARGRGTTTIGADCLLMVASHVAHDCIVGDKVILTNQATLGGHVQVGDQANIGGLAAVQQRCRIGAHAFIGGVCGVTVDVVPFVVALGNRAELAGLNTRGLKRRGFDRATIQALRGAYGMFFFTSGPRPERIAAVAEAFPGVPAVSVFLDFLRASGNRLLALPRGRDDQSDDEES